MPTALPASAALGTKLRHSARFAGLLLQERYLARRVSRASRRQDRIGVDRGGGRLLHFTRRWLACHAAIAALLNASEPADVARMQAIMHRAPCVGVPTSGCSSSLGWQPSSP